MVVNIRQPLVLCLCPVFMCKMEEDVVVPAKPIFYKRYVDDSQINVWMFVS